MQVANYVSPKATKTFVELKLESKFAKKQKEYLQFVAQQELDLLSKKEIIKVLGECKNSPNGPFTSVEELNNLVKKCTLFQQKNMTVENRVRSLTSLIIISSQLGLSASAEIDDLEASVCQRLSMNSEDQHQPSLYEQQ